MVAIAVEKQKVKYPKSLRFTSRYKRYRAVLVPPTIKTIGNEKIRDIGITLEFEDGACFCDNPKAIKLALESGWYGKDFIAPEWEKMKQEAKAKENAK
jgi:hypothetical protein